MPNYQAISEERFGKKYWKEVNDLKFAATQPIIGLVTQELPVAMLEMPIGFIKTKSIYSPIGILGLQSESNLFISKEGKWIGRYLPALLRSYPFLLAEDESKEDSYILCVDEDSGLLTDDNKELPFYAEDGSLGSRVKTLLELLYQVNRNRVSTLKSCKLLDTYGLIKPWPLVIKHDEGEHDVEGFYAVDETALNELDGSAFLELRKSGALHLAYCQLLSMQNIKVLIQRMQETAANSNVQSDELDFSFSDNETSLNFENI